MAVKHIKVLLLTIAFMCFMPSVFADISVLVDDIEIEFSDQAPMIVNDRVLVPMRVIFERLGAYVDWIDETKTVYASKRFTSLMISIGEKEYYLNGELKKLDTPAIVENGRTLVPVRVVAEGLGCEVIWDSANSKALIYKKQGDYIIEDKYIDYWECAEDGTVVMTGRVSYPEIQSDEPVALAFNEYFLGEAEETVLNKRIQLAEKAKADYKEYGENFVPYMLEHSFEVTYNSDNIISLVLADSDFSGGMHPSYEIYGITYNMESGRRLEYTDIIEKSKREIKEAVKAKFSELIDEDSEGFYFDAKDCLDDVLSELKWYVGTDGIHFFLNPYEISPYAKGVVQIIY